MSEQHLQSEICPTCDAGTLAFGWTGTSLEHVSETRRYHCGCELRWGKLSLSPNSTTVVYMCPKDPAMVELWRKRQEAIKAMKLLAYHLDTDAVWKQEVHDALDMHYQSAYATRVFSANDTAEL